MRKPSRFRSFHTLPRMAPLATSGGTVQVGAVVGVNGGGVGICVGGRGVWVGCAGGTGVAVGFGVLVGGWVGGGTGVLGGGGTGVFVGGTGVAVGSGVLVGAGVAVGGGGRGVLVGGTPVAVGRAAAPLAGGNGWPKAGPATGMAKANGSQPSPIITAATTRHVAITNC